MKYVIAWRYNGQVHTETHDYLDHAIWRRNRLADTLGVTHVSLHYK